MVPAGKRCSRGKAREHMYEASLGHAVTGGAGGE